jgi:hypothetical protein
MQRWLYTIFLILGLSAMAARAQDGNWAVGPHLVLSFPQTEFANVSKTGEGLGGKVLYRFNGAPYFALRFDLAYLSYAERRNDAFYMDAYYLVQTRNESFQLTIGPQMSGRFGKFTPYCAMMGGIYNYRSVISAQDYYYGYGIAETTESHTKWGWNANAGLLFDIGLGPFIDLNFKYQTIIGTLSTNVDNKSVKNPHDISVNIGVVFFLKSE